MLNKFNKELLSTTEGWIEEILIVKMGLFCGSV